MYFRWKQNFNGNPENIETIPTISSMDSIATETEEYIVDGGRVMIPGHFALGNTRLGVGPSNVNISISPQLK
ncbi:hypothetical protein evm_014397 [Chilo suppressalis]|nr:hypothetical protein evm_014397 [Chilo suppressalis]